MAILNVKSLNYITSGKTEKLVNVDFVKNKSVSLVANIDPNDESMVENLQSNTSSMKSDGTIIHTMYDIKNLCIKSSIKKSSPTSKLTNTFKDYVDIYAPTLPASDSVIDFCQLYKYSYFLTTKLQSGPNMLETNINEKDFNISSLVNDNNYNLKITGKDPNTYIYKNLDEKTEYLSGHFTPKYNLVDVKYNYVFEIPQSAPINNDYQSGDILGDIFVCKNSYDYSYSMNMPTNQELCSTRDYVGIGVCGNKLFLKFLDNVNYIASDVLPLSGDVKMTQVIDKYPFQKIETIDSINRFRGNVIHKSNMYSIRLNNTSIESLNNDKIPAIKSLYNQIRLDISNNIREITKKVCPANTELFEVQVT